MGALLDSNFTVQMNSELIYSFINIINEMSPYILLGFLIAGLLHVFVPERMLLRHLSGNGLKSVVKAAAIGVPLPLCSCGVLPTAVSLRRGGASKAATTSFLIATPQTGVDSIAATYSLLGLPFAVTRPVAALVCAVLGGSAVGRFDREKASSRSEAAVEPSEEKYGCSDTACCSSPREEDAVSFRHKLTSSIRYGFSDMIDSIGKWLVIGLVVATLITVFVPDDWFVGLREFPLAAMLLVVLIAIPMYVCATGSIPIAMALMLKGLTPGVAFVLLMAGPAANFASVMILNRTVGRKATAIYVASVVITAIAFGCLIDYVLPAGWFAPRTLDAHSICHTEFGWFESGCSLLLAVLLGASAWRTLRRRNEHSHNHNIDSEMTTEYKITGMNCAHCRASVEKAIAAVANVENVDVNLSSGIATVTGTAPATHIEAAVRAAGFDIA